MIDQLRHAVETAARLGLLAMVIGCASPPVPEDVERWGTAWIESLNSHRIQQVMPLLDAAGTYQDPMTGTPLSGASLSMFLTILWNNLPQSHYALRSVNGHREFLAVEWSATGFGEATAMQPLQGVFLIHFNGDRISSVRGYYDAPAK